MDITIYVTCQKHIIYNTKWKISCNFISNGGIELNTATVRSLSTFIFVRYLDFFTPRAENPMLHKYKMGLEFSLLYYLEVAIFIFKQQPKFS